MKLENQVCTLDQAKKLKVLGIAQGSFFTWYGGFAGSEMEPIVDLTDQRMYDVSVNGYYGHPDNTFAAFTAAELGVMIGYDYAATFDAYGKWYWIDLRNEDAYVLVRSGLRTGFDSEAQARADILIHFIEEGKLTIDFINQRLES